MKRSALLKILGWLAAAAVLAVAAITALGMYLNAQDVRSCADLYPTDWQKYDECRAILEKIRERRRILM
jgi:hypothetical protein